MKSDLKQVFSFLKIKTLQLEAAIKPDFCLQSFCIIMWVIQFRLLRQNRHRRHARFAMGHQNHSRRARRRRHARFAADLRCLRQGNSPGHQNQQAPPNYH